MDLSHNPLKVIQDPDFYRLPFSPAPRPGCHPRILEDMLQTPQTLRTLILPRKISCCLCRIKDDLEVLSEQIKMECTNSCPIDLTVCEKEEPLKRMQGQVMTLLDTRKWNGSSLLYIMPERSRAQIDMAELPVHQNGLLAPPPKDSRSAAGVHLFHLIKSIMQVKGDEALEGNWADKRELEKLHCLARLLQEALQTNVVELDKDSPETTVQALLSAQMAPKESGDTSLRKERYVRKVRREEGQSTNQRIKATLFRMGRDG